MRRVDFLIIGGGVIGASIAYHLAKRGAKSIVVIDKSQEPGKGSTGAATGGFRTQFSTSINVKLSLLALEQLKSFKEDTRVDCGYNPRGYMFLASNVGELGALRDAIGVQHAAGATLTREISVDEARELNPAANLDGIVGGTFSPVDGFTRPLEILRGFHGAAICHRVKFEYGTAFIRAQSKNGTITHVRTSQGDFEVGVLINAAGAWAGNVADLCECTLPVKPVPRHVAVTQPIECLTNEMPMTVWATDGFHVRVRDGRALLIWTTKDQPESCFSVAKDSACLQTVYQRALQSFPCLKNAPLDIESSWCGLYEMSPDKTAILGLAPGFSNLYLANGSSGHGVMHSPALGRLLAELILDGKTSIDISALSPDRFRNEVMAPTRDIL